MTGIKLEPCPFCGGPAEIVDIDEGENAGGSCVCCTSCLASGNVEFEFKENFVANWNRRAVSEHVEPAPEAGVVPAGYRMVPEAALAWLFGEGPDEDGLHFGEGAGPKSRGAFWWRPKFAAMLAASPPPPSDPVALRFPTMLRKMWSGEEVQSWLNKLGPLYAAPTPVGPDLRAWMKEYIQEGDAIDRAIADGRDPGDAAYDRRADLRAKIAVGLLTPSDPVLQKLVEALKPFADLGVGSGPDYETETYRITREAIRAARAALALVGEVG